MNRKCETRTAKVYNSHTLSSDGVDLSSQQSSQARCGFVPEGDALWNREKVMLATK